MKILKAAYIGSYHKLEDTPKELLPDFAFIGRSNVGKSSLINMLTGRKKLAKTSAAPGKTQSINFFEIESEKDGHSYYWHIIDLPGYGYARRSKSDRKTYKRMIDDVLRKRRTLVVVFQLIDINVPPQANDIENINYMGGLGIPFVIVFTKVDRQKAKKNAERYFEWKKELLKTWEEMPPHFMSSAIAGEGREELLQFIAGTIDELRSLKKI